MSIRIGKTTEDQAFIYNSTTDELIGRLWSDDEYDYADVIARQFLQEYLTDDERSNIQLLGSNQLEEKVKAFHKWREEQKTQQRIEEFSCSLN